MKDVDRLDKNRKVLDGEINRLDRNSEKIGKGVNDHIQKMPRHDTKIAKRRDGLENQQRRKVKK